MVLRAKSSSLSKVLLSTLVITVSVFLLLSSNDIFSRRVSFMKASSRELRATIKLENNKWHSFETAKAHNTVMTFNLNLTYNATLLQAGESQFNQRRRLPQVIIVGAKKSGTKALLSFLAANPFVKACEREVHFFDKAWDNGLDWYKEQMPLSFPYQLTIEKSPRYFVSPQTPPRIHRALPNIRLLFIFRNPTIRALSDYAHIVAKKRKSPTRAGAKITFENAVFADKREGRINYSNPIISTGRYGLHLLRWLKYFKLQQMYFVDGETLVSQPWKEIISVQKFLGLPILVDETSFVFNKSKRFYCVKRKFLRWKGKISLYCLGKNKGRSHPKISKNVTSILNAYFKPYNQLLYNLTRRDFHWPS